METFILKVRSPSKLRLIAINHSPYESPIVYLYFSLNDPTPPLEVAQEIRKGSGSNLEAGIFPHQFRVIGNLTVMFNYLREQHFISDEERGELGAVVQVDAKEQAQREKLKPTVTTSQLELFQSLYELYLEHVAECIKAPELFARALSSAFSRNAVPDNFMCQEFFTELKAGVDIKNYSGLLESLAYLNKILFGKSNFENTFTRIADALPTLQAQRNVVYVSAVKLLNQKLIEFPVDDKQKVFCHFVLYRCVDSSDPSFGLQFPGKSHDAAQFRTFSGSALFEPTYILKIAVKFLKICQAAELSPESVYQVGTQILSAILKPYLREDISVLEAKLLDPNVQFTQSIIRENLAEMIAAIQAGANINASHSVSGTALCSLIDRRNQAMLLELLRHQPDINQFSGNSECNPIRSAINVSLKQDDTHYFELILRCKPNLWLRSPKIGDLLQFILMDIEIYQRPWSHPTLLKITQTLLRQGVGVDADLRAIPVDFLKDCLAIGATLPKDAEAITTAEAFIQRISKAEHKDWELRFEQMLQCSSLKSETKIEIRKIQAHLNTEQSKASSEKPVTKLHSGFFNKIGSKQICYFQRFISPSFQRSIISSDRADAIVECKNSEDANSIAEKLSKFGITAKINEASNGITIVVEDITTLNSKLSAMK